jgi:F-type H+-transporting ATPase subunit b
MSKVEDLVGLAVKNQLPIERDELFYESAEFWVSLAFIAIIILLFPFLYRTIKGAIYGRIQRIKDELSEAENVKLEAQELYAKYERNLLNVDNEVAQIIHEEENYIADMRERKNKEFDALLLQKHKETQSRMNVAFEKVNAEINEKIAKETMAILKTAVNEKLTKTEHEKIIDTSVTMLEEAYLKK